MESIGCIQSLTDLESALAHKGPRLRFMPRLEAAYQAARTAERSRAIAAYLAIYLMAKLLFLVANLQVGSEVFRVSMMLRLGIVLPLTVTAIFLLLRPLPSWVHALAAFGPLIAETALVMLLGRLSGSAVSARYLLAAIVGIFAQTLLMRAPFRQCLYGFLVAIAVFCTLCEVRWPGHFGPPVTLDFLIFGTVFCLPALYERHSRERADRREFLLDEINRRRMEDIQCMNQHLERLTSVDSLTGVFNRRYLDAALPRLCEIAIENERWIAIILIDVDEFKSINDSSGHRNGDLCLENVAQALQHSIRAGVDTVVRYGGDEFMVILPDANEREATLTGERMRKTIETAAMPAGQRGMVTISAGATAVRGKVGSTLSADDLIATADEALYRAKELGRNRVVYCGRTLSVSQSQLALG